MNKKGVLTPFKSMEKSLILFVKCANAKGVWGFCFLALKKLSLAFLKAQF
ncbi:hypothetical protein HPPN135_05990 [Helicobacter pylori Puno135]|nr:hypothetical protein HPPN135_05990 [Helicobacter pylori Puno135]